MNPSHHTSWDRDTGKCSQVLAKAYRAGQIMKRSKAHRRTGLETVVTQVHGRKWAPLKVTVIVWF